MKKPAHRQSNHVVPQQGHPSNPIILPENGDNNSDEQEPSTSRPDRVTVTLELVRPDEVFLNHGFVEDQDLVVGPAGSGPYPDRCARRFTENETLGTVATTIRRVYDVGVEEQVAFYPTSERSEALSNDTTVGDLQVSTLYWEVITVEVEV